MATKCGRCSFASHCIQLAVFGKQVALAVEHQDAPVLPSGRQAPILLVRATPPSLPRPAVRCRRAGLGWQSSHRGTAAGPIGNAMLGARGPTVCVSSDAGDLGSSRAARRPPGRGSRQRRSGRRRTSRARAPEWSRASSASRRQLRTRRRCPDRPSRSVPPRPSSRNSRRAVGRRPTDSQRGRASPNPRDSSPASKEVCACHPPLSTYFELSTLHSELSSDSRHLLQNRANGGRVLRRPPSRWQQCIERLWRTGASGTPIARGEIGDDPHPSARPELHRGVRVVALHHHRAAHLEHA